MKTKTSKSPFRKVFAQSRPLQLRIVSLLEKEIEAELKQLERN